MLPLLAEALDLSLPLKNPVLIFSLILFIILFAPLILNRLKIPYLIGLIIAGAFIGPNGFNFLLRDESVTLFGTVGLLYIMFLAGLEIDLGDFKKNSSKSAVFGLLTFLIPMTLGTAAGYYVLEFPLKSSILLASMFASHTLIAYPIISKLGVAKNRAVNITVGGTIITDTLALLVLAAIVGMSKGTADTEFWVKLGVSTVVMAMIILFGFPLLGRWFFKNFDNAISQYIFVLALVFMGGFLAEAAGIEAIIGAFLAGLALNRLVPHTSALMNRIEFVGNALFIPFFLIGVGMLIDYKVFFQDIETLKVAGVMIVIANLSKFLAAWATQKIYGFSKEERSLIFGLSNAQAAATLAAVLVGFKLGLLSETVLNGTILMILFTCTIASIVAQRGASKIALLESVSDEEDDTESPERILLAVNDSDITEKMVNLTVTLKSKQNRSGLFVLNVMAQEEEGGASEKQARKILDKAAVAASATDDKVHELLRYDLNIVNGISGVVKEHKITDLVLGVTTEKGISDNFLGHLTEGILTKCNTTTIIYKAAQPLATVKRHLVIVPHNAEREMGFPFWLVKVWNLARNTGAKLVFYAPENTLKYLKDIQSKHPIVAEFEIFSDWSDFLILSRDLGKNDNMLVIMSRKEHQSYDLNMDKIPSYLNKYFKENNYLLIYPMQTGVKEDDNVNLNNPSAVDTLEKLDDMRKVIGKLFRKLK